MAERVRDGEVPADQDARTPDGAGSGTAAHAPPAVEQDRRPWWRTRRGLLLALLLVAFTGQMVWTAARTQLVDERVAVVSLRVGISAEQRQEIRETCSGLPGVALVDDVGRPDLARRFPARFSLAGATLQEEGGLLRCLEQFDSDIVTYQVEGRA